MKQPNKSESIVGGQAVMEGVMMRRGDRIATAVRTTDQQIVIREETYVSLTKRFKPLGLPIIRGFISLIEMLVIGMRTILYSAESVMERPQKGGEVAVMLSISMGMGILLFIVAPAYCFSLMREAIANTLLLNVLEGLIRLGIFLGFLSATLLMADMRRLYMYHGAEHMTVFAWEAGTSLTIEEVRRYSTRHPRCGTSFILFVMIVSILVFSMLGRPDFVHRVIYKLMLFPLVAGISYELIRFAGRHHGRRWVQMISWPGLVLQKITTRKPTDDMLEVAIAAMKKVI